MKSIPRLIAGTAVVLAAVLTSAPVTAGIADLVLNPGQQPAKRAAPQALPGASNVTAPLTRRDDDGEGDAASDDDGASGTLTIVADRDSSPEPSATTELTAAPVASRAQAAGLVALTAADADSRVSDLASDLQAGVDAGEFSQSDAERVLGDISSYIRGERTWPERTVA